MPKGYWITRVDVYDAEQFEKYKAANIELFVRYEASLKNCCDRASHTHDRHSGD